MSLLTKMATIVLVTIVCLIIFDVVGLVVSFILEVFSSETETSSGFYELSLHVIWLVTGVNCGMFAYLTAGDLISSGTGFGRTSDEGAIRTGRLVLSTTISMLAALLAVGDRYLWPAATSANAPDGELLTITFFAGIVISEVLGYRATTSVRR